VPGCGAPEATCDVRLIGGHLGDTDPNVAPDGKTVTFVRRKKGHEQQALFAIGIDGSRLRQLTPYKDEIAIKHAWSPDGRRIAVTDNADWVRPEASANILTFRADGSARKHLTHYDGGQVRGLNAFTGSYSPDGRHIVLRVERNDNGGLAIMDADGKNPRITPFMTGFLDSSTEAFSGRPTYFLQLPDGSLLVSDEQLGAIYRISYAR